MPLARPETLLVYLSNGTWLKRETHVVLRDDGKRVLLKGTPARPHPPLQKQIFTSTQPSLKKVF